MQALFQLKACCRRSDYYHFSHDTVYDRTQMFKVIQHLFVTYKIIKVSHG